MISVGVFYAPKRRELKIYHGGTESPRRKCKCGVYFVHAGTRDQNKRHGFLKEYFEMEELS
jgi:hypothetical protein